MANRDCLLPNMSDELIITDYTEIYHDSLVRWLKARGKDPRILDNLPYLGIVAIYDSTPVATAFLRQAEGGVGFIEGLCTNPDAASLIRHIAIDELVKQIIEMAKSIQIHSLIAWSVDKGTLLRSERFGFKKQEETLISLKLNFEPDLH